MYATDRRQTDIRQTKASLNASALRGRGHNNGQKHVVRVVILVQDGHTEHPLPLG